MHPQRRSSWQAATAPVPAQRVNQRARVVPAATRAGRKWGSGWGRMNKQTTVEQPEFADNSLLQQQQQALQQQQQQALQQQLQQQQALQQQPGVRQQKSATVKDYAAAYDAVADAIQEEFVKKEIRGCCLPTSLLFYEAVKAVNPAADPQFVLGYVVMKGTIYAGEPDLRCTSCGRHLWVELDSRKYDIGRRVAAALILRKYGTEAVLLDNMLTQVRLERPPDAIYIGWNQGEDSLVPLVTTEKQDAAQLKQFRRKSGRRLFWAAAPKDVLAVRADILSRTWLINAKGSKGCKGFGAKTQRTEE